MTAVVFSVSCTEETTVSFSETSEAFRNPMKGWRDFFGVDDPKRADFPYPWGSIIKEYMQWNMMERTAEDGLDKVIAYSNHRWEGYEDMNMKVIPRAYIVWTEPWHGMRGKMEDEPDDLYGQHWPDDIEPQTSAYRNKDGGWACYVPEADSLTRNTGGYWDPTFPDRVRAMVKKLGEAWDNDPRVAYVEMGIIGEWGEQHDPDITTYWPPHDEPEHVPGRTWIEGIDTLLGNAFTQAFKNKKVMVRYAYDFPDYEFGFYWDSWAIDQEEKRCYETMMATGDRWKSQVVGGEITWGWGSLAEKGLKGLQGCLKDKETYELTVNQIRELHCNHLGGITWAPFGDTLFVRLASELQKIMGYRFFLEDATYSVSRKGVLRLDCSVKNLGSSPFYYKWPVEVSLLDPETKEKVFATTLDDIDITSWLPGDNWSRTEQRYMTAPETNRIEACITLPDSLPEGRYILALAVLDPAGNLPSLRFANTNYLEGGYTPLGYVGTGGEKIGSPEIDPSEFTLLQDDHTLKYLLPLQK